MYTADEEKVGLALRYVNDPQMVVVDFRTVLTMDFDKVFKNKAADIQMESILGLVRSE